MKFNYSKIYKELLVGLADKQKKVISRRFGLGSGSGNLARETLEAIGEDYKITRERVRQIEKDALLKLKPKVKEYNKIFSFLKESLNSRGGFVKEAAFLEQLGGKEEKNQVYFLLSLSDDFTRFSESPDFHSFWATNKNSYSNVEEIIKNVTEKLKKLQRTLSLKEIKNALDKSSLKISQASLVSSLEISKHIGKNNTGLFGLKEWPEINPRGIKDKAFLVFRDQKKPLHFTKVASLINSALPQTVHNELIKDERFVLVGRGIYALKEWGYEEGDVKDIISSVLKRSKRPMMKKEIVDKVLEQRIVQKNTVFLNLSNKKYFSRNNKGFYKINVKTA